MNRIGMERSGGIRCRSKSKAAVGQASGGSKLGGAKTLAAAVACGLWSQKAGGDFFMRGKAGATVLFFSGEGFYPFVAVQSSGISARI